MQGVTLAHSSPSQVSPFAKHAGEFENAPRPVAKYSSDLGVAEELPTVQGRRGKRPDYWVYVYDAVTGRRYHWDLQTAVRHINDVDEDGTPLYLKKLPDGFAPPRGIFWCKFSRDYEKFDTMPTFSPRPCRRPDPFYTEADRDVHMRVYHENSLNSLRNYEMERERERREAREDVMVEGQRALVDQVMAQRPAATTAVAEPPPDPKGEAKGKAKKDDPRDAAE